MIAEDLKNVSSYEEMKEIALKILSSSEKPWTFVCGPISSGGLGSIEKNLEVFDKVIEKLKADKENVFDLVPFEEPMQKIKAQNPGLSKEEKNQALLDGFYLPIYESGFVTKFYFIPGWQSSHGATWERQKAKELGIEIVDLPKDFLD